MKIIRTGDSKPNDIKDQQERDWIYNGLDCAITLEILETILPQLGPETTETYNLSRGLQGPVLEMRLRGVLVDEARKSEVVAGYRDRISNLEDQLEYLAIEGAGMTSFNWKSYQDLHTLFYDKLKIPPIKRHGKPTVDRNALEKLQAYTVAKPFVAHMIAMRDVFQRIKMLTTEIDPDGRIRTSYNIAGTDTGRFSSSFSEFGTGGNLQNVEKQLRSIFVSDLGWKFAKFDAKSGESYVVGGIEWNLFKDGRYLDAVESGDVHTSVAKLCWPMLGWTGDLGRDKDLAERPFYRHHSYRFMCKKLGHGSNYGGQPETLSEQTKLPISVVRAFQPKYFSAFPAHLKWHEWIRDQLYKSGYLVNLTGRKRWFFGRRNDPDTIRAAIAYDPQGSLADIVNRAMLRIWRWAKANNEPVIIMMKDHDAITFMYPEHLEETYVPLLREMLVEEVPLKYGRTLRIPYDCQVGWNKGEYDEATNPDGLKDYKGKDQRTRSPKVKLLDRVIHRRHGTIR